MKGRRLSDFAGVDEVIETPGSYLLRPSRTEMWLCLPIGQPAHVHVHDAGAAPAVTDRPSWELTEHEDGSITLAPSLLLDCPGVGGWHGYLERGVWREV